MLVKVCGMTLPGQVAALDDLGVDFLGFIFAAKSPRKVTPEHVASIPKGRAKRVGVFVEQSADEVRRIMDAAGLDFAQLHAGQDEDFCRAVGPERVIKVFWPQKYLAAELNTPGGLCTDSVGRANEGEGHAANPGAGSRDQTAIDRALEALRRDMGSFRDFCAMMLCDSGTSGGGHGKSLDFSALAGLDPPRPWLLAGGLSTDNAATALAQSRPSGLDLNSGVESSPGVKDIHKVRQAFQIIKSL